MKTLFQILTVASLIVGINQFSSAKDNPVYTGEDDQGNSCWVKVLSVTEEVDTGIPNRDIWGDNTNVKKTIRFRLSFQYDASTIFTATSNFDDFGSAYESWELYAQNKLEKDRFENIKVFLNPGSDQTEPRSVDYYRDPKVMILGIPFGSVENSCRKLELRKDEDD